MTLPHRAHPGSPPSKLAGAGWSTVAALLVATAGCSEELGPETFPTASVRGRVTEGGKPVGRGWIEFYPVEGSVGNLRSAKIGRDGSFAADGVAVGRNLVRLVDTPVDSLSIRRILGAFHSPIRRQIPADGDRAIAVEVIDEFVRYQQSTAGSQAGIRR